MASHKMASVSASKKKGSKHPAGKVHRMQLEAADNSVIAHASRPGQTSKDEPYTPDEDDLPMPHTSMKSLQAHIKDSFGHLFPGKAGAMGGSDKAGMGRQPDDSATESDEV